MANKSVKLSETRQCICEIEFMDGGAFIYHKMLSLSGKGYVKHSIYYQNDDLRKLAAIILKRLGEKGQPSPKDAIKLEDAFTKLLIARYEKPPRKKKSFQEK